jgi:hypothetical protein
MMIIDLSTNIWNNADDLNRQELKNIFARYFTVMIPRHGAFRIDPEHEHEEVPQANGNHTEEEDDDSD